MLQITDKTHNTHHNLQTDSSVFVDATEKATATVDINEIGTLTSIHPEEPEETDNISSIEPTVTTEVVEYTTSDEGWQEANSKGQSGNATGKKHGRKKPVLAKLKVNGCEYSNGRENRSRRDVFSPAGKTVPKNIIKEMQTVKQSKSSSLNPRGTSIGLPASVSRGSSPSANLSAIASKSLSYKEVAAAPPGTVLKPLLEQSEGKMEQSMCTKTANVEDGNNISVVDDVADDNGETEGTHDTESQSEETAPEIDKVSSCSQEKGLEAKGSKLSASAEPFNPGALYLPLNSVSVTCVYDVTSSQGMLAEPVVPPVAARVPCGPRLQLFYRNNNSYSNFLRYQTPILEQIGFGTTRVMNPHAPEFVPSKIWQITGTGDSSVSEEAMNTEVKEVDTKSSREVKDSNPKKSSTEEKSELARQVLLSFIVRSAKKNVDGACEALVNDKMLNHSQNSSDAVTSDTAIIKILFGNEGKELDSQSSSNEEPKALDVIKKKPGDGEGFTVVKKRRKNRQQLTNGVTGLYNQQSICASVR